MWAALASVAAAWTKEPAIIVATALLGLEVLQSIRSRFRDRTGMSSMFAGVALAPAPMLASRWLGAPWPGWVLGGDPLVGMDLLLGSSLLLPLLVAALAVRRARAMAAVELSLVAFFLVDAVVLHKRIQSWYGVIPTTFAVATLVIAAATGPWSRMGVLGRRIRLFLPVLVLTPLFVSGCTSTPGPGRSWATPYADVIPAFPDLTPRLLGDNADLAQSRTVLERNPSARVLTVDVSWLYLYFPFDAGDAGELVVWSNALRLFNESWSPVIDQARVPGTLLVVGHTFEVPGVSRELADAFRDCRLLATPDYDVYRPSQCPASDDISTLPARLEALRDPP